MIDQPNYKSMKRQKKLWQLCFRVDFGIQKWFFSSQGHEIYQNIVESGGGISSICVMVKHKDGSYPQSFGEL